VIYGWAIPVAAIVGVGSYMIYTYFIGGHIASVTVVFFVMVLLIAFGAAWWHQRVKRYLVTQMSYGGVSAEFNAKPIQFLKKYFFAGLIAMGGSAIVGMLSSTLLRGGGGRASFIVVSIVSYAASIVLFTYIRTRITNLVWNNARLGPLHFESRLLASSLIGLYFSNAVAILFSAGILIPWATMRTLKYRVENFTVSVEGELAEFQGSDTSTVRAAGAEVGDLLDFDMSI
jgi:uncharacterized membrane protein YjgN (DUF898 family)